MRAMIFAAGFGKRMMPLTQNCPKPLLLAANKPLIEYHLEKLAACGITDVVINVSYLGDKIISLIGDGARWGLCIQYSVEPQPLETYGGLMHAFDFLVPSPHLDEPFLLLNADVYCDVDFAEFIEQSRLALSKGCLGNLLMVENPPHNTSGDFSINEAAGLLHKLDGRNTSTFSGVSVLRPSVLKSYPATSGKLSEVFNLAMQASKLSATLYAGLWRDIGTPERLNELNAQLSAV